MVMIPNAPKMSDMPKSEPIPPGVYHVRCEKASYEVGKGEKKTPYAATQWSVFGPEEMEEFHGRKLFTNLMLSGKGMFQTRQVLEAAGWDDETQLEDTDQLIDIEAAAVVEIEPEKEIEGKLIPPRNVIVRFLAIA